MLNENNILIDNLDTIGKRIKCIRLARRMTRKELGTLMDLKHSDERIDAYETGKRYPKDDMILKLSNALGVSFIWLKKGILDNKTKEIFEKYNLLDVIYNCPPQPFDNLYQMERFLNLNQEFINHNLKENNYRNIFHYMMELVEKNGGNIYDFVSFKNDTSINECAMEKETNINYTHMDDNTMSLINEYLKIPSDQQEKFLLMVKSIVKLIIS